MANGQCKADKVISWASPRAYETISQKKALRAAAWDAYARLGTGVVFGNPRLGDPFLLANVIPEENIYFALYREALACGRQDDGYAARLFATNLVSLCLRRLKMAGDITSLEALAALLEWFRKAWLNQGVNLPAGIVQILEAYRASSNWSTFPMGRPDVSA